MDRACLVAIRHGGQERLALKVRVKGSNVYINYFAPDGTKQAHTSYHASGQEHIKKGRDYVYWSDDPAGEWRPLKVFKQPPGAVADREECSTIGWGIGSLPSRLPVATGPVEMVVDASALPASSILALVVSVIGAGATERPDVLGFPVVQRHRVSNGVVLEIEAILLDETALEA